MVEATAPCRLTDGELIERARAMDAASLLALKRQAEADEQIETLLRSNPQYAPSPAQYPQEVIDRFTIVRRRIRASWMLWHSNENATSRRHALPRKRARPKRSISPSLCVIASEERVVQKSSRRVAMIPFGIGHFQNGTDGRAWAFLVGESLAGATSLVAVLALNKIASSTNGSCVPATCATLNDQANAATVVNRVAFTAWAATTVADVVGRRSPLCPSV